MNSSILSKNISKPLPGNILDPNDSINTGLTACWLLNEGAGKYVNDLTGLRPATLHGANLTRSNGATGTGIRNTGTGSTDFLSFGSYTTGTTFSWEALIYYQTSGVNGGCLFAPAAGTGTGIYIFTGNKLDFYDNTTNHFGSTAIPTNAWTHLAISVKAGAVTLYWNGRPDGTFSGLTTGIVGNPQVFTDNNSNFWTGRLNHMRVWNRAISSFEVQRLAGDYYAGILPMIINRIAIYPVYMPVMPSQRFDNAIDLNYSYWEQSKQGINITPVLIPQPNNQRFDILPIPDYSTYYEQQEKEWPIPTEFVKLFPPVSQQINILPDYTYTQWEQFKQQPIPIGFTKLFTQPSQRFDSLPNWNYNECEQLKLQPITISFIIPQQNNQRYDAIPDYTFTQWEQLKQIPIITSIVPQKNIQQFDSLPVTDYNWWEQIKVYNNGNLYPSVRSSISAINQTGSSFGVFSPPLIQNGDLLIYFQATYLAGGSTPVPSSGWSLLQVVIFSVSNYVLYCYYKIANNEPASYIFNNPIGGSGGHSNIYILAIQNADSTSIINNFNSGNNTSANIVALGVTTLTNNNLIITGYAGGINAGSSITPPGTMIDLGSLNNSNVILDVSYQNENNSGATGNFTATAVGGNVFWVALTLAISPIIIPDNPATQQLSQRFDILPDYNFNWWEQLRDSPIPITFVSPLFTQANQQIEILPDYNFNIWEQFKQQPIPKTFLPPLYVPSQRFDTLPELYTWWEQFRLQPVEVTFLPPLYVPSQRFDTLPNNNYNEWEQLRKVPIPITFLVTPFPQQNNQRYDTLVDNTYTQWEQSRQNFINLSQFTYTQPSQRFDTSIDLNYTQWEYFKKNSVIISHDNPTIIYSQRTDSLPDNNFNTWEQIRKQPTPIGFTKLFPQASQQINVLPVHDYYWWEQFSIHPVTPHDSPVFNYSQRFDAIPDYTFNWWEIVKDQPIPVSYIPDNPATKQPSQRFDSLPNWNYNEWQQLRLTPIPTPNVPDISIIGQPSQRFDVLPDYFDFAPWQPVTKRLPPSFFVSNVFGYYGFYIQVIADPGMQGSYGIQNASLVGYNIYVGINTPPDFSTPDYFTTTLPYAIPHPLPISGIDTLQVVVRSQDQYGLESANQYITSIILNSTNVLLVPVNIPQNVKASFIADNDGVKITAQYPTLYTDKDAADKWYVYISSIVLIPGTDLPTNITPVSNPTLAANIFPIGPGTYNVIVALYRTKDSSLAIAPTITVTVPTNPITPKPVLSGFESPPA